MKTVKFGKLKEQKYAMKESLRALKTNIQFCGDDIQTIVVTSAMPNEGKSTVTMDLARSLTESGKRVLLIDTDMRKSVYVGRLRAVASDGGEIYGLSHFLSGQKRLEDVLYGTEISGLFMIFAGPSVPNPTEILEKNYFIEFITRDYNYRIKNNKEFRDSIKACKSKTEYIRLMFPLFQEEVNFFDAPTSVLQYGVVIVG